MDACHIWPGSVDRDGYAVYGKPRVRVARIICEAGPGEVACHHCDTPLCVNPKHIYRGTRKSNMDDRARRGRWSGGPTSRLTADQVAAIRADPRMHKEIAPDYGMSKAMIGMIKRGERPRKAVF